MSTELSSQCCFPGWSFGACFPAVWGGNWDSERGDAPSVPTEVARGLSAMRETDLTVAQRLTAVGLALSGVWVLSHSCPLGSLSALCYPLARPALTPALPGGCDFGSPRPHPQGQRQGDILAAGDSVQSGSEVRATMGQTAPRSPSVPSTHLLLRAGVAGAGQGRALPSGDTYHPGRKTGHHGVLRPQSHSAGMRECPEQR